MAAGDTLGSRLGRVIVDRGCRIPEGMRIGLNPEEDRSNGFRVSAGGVTLITRGMLGQAEGSL